MKKIKLLTLLVVLTVAVVVSGCSAGTDEVITADNIGEYVQLGNYKGLEYSVPLPEVTQEEIDQTVESILLSSSAPQEVTDRPAELGDVLNIDFVGKLDGVAFDGGAGEGYDLTLGSNTFIDGFEEQLVGAEKGEKRDLDLVFPDPYSGNPDLAGKPVVFEVTVNSISVYETPELTQEFVQEAFQMETVEEFMTNLEMSILLEKQASSSGLVVEQVLAQASENATFLKLPENAMKTYNDGIVSQYEAYAESAGLRFSDVVEELTGMPEDQFLESIEAETEQIFKERLILQAIGYIEDLSITEEEYTSGIEVIAQQLGYPSSVELLEVATEEELRQSLINEKAMSLIVENSKDLNPPVSTDDDDDDDDDDDADDTDDDADDVNDDADDMDDDADDMNDDADDMNDDADDVDDDADDVNDDADDNDDDTDDGDDD